MEIITFSKMSGRRNIVIPQDAISRRQNLEQFIGVNMLTCESRVITNWTTPQEDMRDS